MKTDNERVKEAIEWAIKEWKTSENTKTHKVVNSSGEVEFSGTKDGCKIFIAANGPIYEVLNLKLKIRKIK